MIPSNNNSMWAFIAPSLYPGGAAAMAIFPVFYGFMVKSAQQTGKPIPPLDPKVMVNWGGKGAIVLGTQVFAQDLFRRAIKADDASCITEVGTSIVASILTSPILTALNALSLKKSMVVAIRNLTPKQVGYLTGRDSLFLISTRVSDPLGETLKGRYGDHPLVEHVANFASGAIGALFGHPCDTAFCRSGQGLPTSAKYWTLGLPTRMSAVGFLVVFYKAILKQIY